MWPWTWEQSAHPWPIIVYRTPAARAEVLTIILELEPDVFTSHLELFTSGFEPSPSMLPCYVAGIVCQWHPGMATAITALSTVTHLLLL